MTIASRALDGIISPVAASTRHIPNGGIGFKGIKTNHTYLYEVAHVQRFADKRRLLNLEQYFKTERLIGFLKPDEV